MQDPQHTDERAADADHSDDPTDSHRDALTADESAGPLAIDPLVPEVEQ